MADNSVTPLSLEARLKSDDDGTFHRTVIGEFEELSGDLKRQLDKGLPEEDYKSLSGLKSAVDEAKEVVKTAWEGYLSKV